MAEIKFFFSDRVIIIKLLKKCHVRSEWDTLYYNRPALRPVWPPVHWEPSLSQG